MARMADVATTAGVSAATVDRVLHGRPGVRPATVARVLEVAAELGYVPDAALDALRAPRPAAWCCCPREATSSSPCWAGNSQASAAPPTVTLISDLANSKRSAYRGWRTDPPGTRRLLLDGSLDAVLNQDPRETVLGAASVFANLRSGLEPMAGIRGTRTGIVLREKLP